MTTQHTYNMQVLETYVSHVAVTKTIQAVSNYTNLQPLFDKMSYNNASAGYVKFANEDEVKVLFSEVGIGYFTNLMYRKGEQIEGMFVIARGADGWNGVYIPGAPTFNPNTMSCDKLDLLPTLR